MDLKVEPEELDSNQPPPIEVFAHSSTLHGISHIFTYERFWIKRFLWLVFFLASLTFLLYVCVDRIHFYLEYPHVTKLDEVSTPVMTFPAVTFCNLNAFRFSQLTRNDLFYVGELLALLNNSSYNVMFDPILRKSPSGCRACLSLLNSVNHKNQEAPAVLLVQLEALDTEAGSGTAYCTHPQEENKLEDLFDFERNGKCSGQQGSVCRFLQQFNSVKRSERSQTLSEMDSRVFVCLVV
ncbi:hypothetical protein CCH79_00006589 [Gambusia affinis]|uniref:Uncharacterized protein n=1 Tax=Gambusia affinis TaxID=33528 RepID=A0A315W7I2_GAMAF|nr:hypothetical protein CCH79_00006589 [Gambusia affinis]